MSVTLASNEESFGGLARQMGKILEQLNKGHYSFFYTNETWTPNVNLYETEDAYQVCVDLAGVDKDKIEIEVHQQRLTVKGHRVVPTPSPTDGIPAAAGAPAGAGASSTPGVGPGVVGSGGAGPGVVASPRDGNRNSGGNQNNRDDSPPPHARRIKVHLMEIDHGSFARVVELPHDVAEHRINAEYRNGILWIELPKK